MWLDWGKYREVRKPFVLGGRRGWRALPPLWSCSGGDMLLLYCIFFDGRRCRFKVRELLRCSESNKSFRQFQKKLPRKMEAAAKAEKLFLRQVHFTSLIILHFPPSSSTKQVIESLPSRSSSFQSPFCLRIVCSHRLSNQHIVFHLPVIVRSQNALEVRSLGKKIPEVGIPCASLKRSYS